MFSIWAVCHVVYHFVLLHLGDTSTSLEPYLVFGSHLAAAPGAPRTISWRKSGVTRKVLQDCGERRAQVTGSL